MKRFNPLLIILCFITLTLNAQEKTMASKALLRGEVQDISKNKITINIGQTSGVVLGMVFDAYADDKSYKLPFSGETVVREGRVVGRFKVVDLSANFCIAQKTTEFKTHVGQLVLGRGVAETGNQPPRINKIDYSKQTLCWGRPLTVSVEGDDQEKDKIFANASVDKGWVYAIDALRFVVYPPHGKGQLKLTLSLSDGIGSDKQIKMLHYDSDLAKGFERQGNVMIGPKRFNFNTIDQLVVDNQGHLWVLDKDLNRIVTLSDTLHEKKSIDLKKVIPKRFSVNGSHIAVLEESKVQLYTRDGQWVRHFGSQGHQVHQWEEAGDVLLLTDSTVAILDTDRQTVILYSDEGQFIACCGYPAKVSPGFLKAKWLEAHDNGFAVIDIDQRQRLIFDSNYRYKESLPMEELMLPLSGPGNARSFPVQKYLKKQELTAIARSHDKGWYAVDKEGQRLWKIKDVQRPQLLTWKSYTGQHRLKANNFYTYWLDRHEEKLFEVDKHGWRRVMATPKCEKLAAYLPGSPALFLDQDTRRIHKDKKTFGQKGDGKGMLDEPDDLLNWNQLNAVLDVDNEKVVLFKKNDVATAEHSFEDCLSFCVSHKNEMWVLCSNGQTWKWKAPHQKPVAVKGPDKAHTIRRVGSWIAFLTHDDRVILYDENMKEIQSLGVDRPRDAVLTSLGVLWVYSGSKGLVKFHTK